MSLIQKFNDFDKSKIINNLEFMSFSDNVNIEDYKISIPYNHMQIDGIDMEGQMFKVLINEINSSIYNKVIKNLFSSTPYDFIDNRGKELEINFRDLIPNITGMIDGYKHIICSSLLGGLFQDSASFSNVILTSNLSTNNYVYKIGRLSGIDIWVDPYMKYNDTRLVAFDNVNFKIEDIKIQEVVDNYSFQPRMISEIHWGYKINNSKVIYLLTDQSSPDVYNEFKKIDREIKINKLLDE